MPDDRLPNRNDAVLSLLQLSDTQYSQDPHSLYRSLRERDPVYWDPYMHAWIVTSYAEVVTVLSSCLADRAVSRSYLESLGLSFMWPIAEMMPLQIMFKDGVSHTRLRALCVAAFSPNRVERMRILIKNVADKLLMKMTEAGGVDLVAEFATPLPAIVTAELLGVPVDDYQLVNAWVLDVAEVLGSFQHHPDRISKILRSLQQLQLYLAERMEKDRRKPGDGLIGAFMAAEIDGNRMTDDEVIANLILVLVGGQETTSSLIASGFLTLLTRTEAFEQLRTQPNILCSAVEELLRFECPSQSTTRIAPTDLSLGGKVIKRGELIIACLAAANRDPARFPEPDRLNLERLDNRHLAFGWASHFCFGAPLARMEAQIALSKLLATLPSPRLANEKFEWRNNSGFRSLKALHIQFER